MRQFIGAFFLIAGLYLSYQGSVNSRPGPVTEGLARDAACDAEQGCKLASPRPRVTMGRFTGRVYEWNTTAGPRTVECQREYLFAGHWRCAARAGSLKLPESADPS